MLTRERLTDLLEYLPETGQWVSRVKRGRFPAGTVAGYSDRENYIIIMIDYVRYRAHRLTWFLFHGEMPSQQIDHIDRNPRNNRIENLREASPTENGQNKVRARSDSTSKLIGVSLDKRRGEWRARITVGRREHHLGYFATKEEASAAYWKAKPIMHPTATL